EKYLALSLFFPSAVLVSPPCSPPSLSAAAIKINKSRAGAGRRTTHAPSQAAQSLSPFLFSASSLIPTPRKRVSAGGREDFIFFAPKMSSPSKRREMDLMKLMMSDYKVEMVNDGMQEFFVEFRGPTER
uniref:Uncharacterized protein n=1 Tax=Aegilops tauschii subsp. strangulata TaxID=200361 RepID=A0A452YBR3_AEGTS